MAFNVFEMFGKIGAKDEASKVIDSVVSKAKAADHTLSDGLKSIGSTVSGVGDKLTSFITKPAIGAATALGSITLVKGFNRLTGIDDARAKLLGLGHDGQSVEEIMKSALASVKGTSFGMDEAATTAAGAVAAGVEQGEKLTKYLSITADAAAIAGTSLADMGSIINKVQTGQQAYTDDLNQLADRGLPIYQWLGQEAGVAAGEVKALASEGKISSEMFLNAIEKNIGGAAAIMGESSFKSTIANIGASIGRIGANFLDAGGKGGGFFSTLKPLLSDFNKSLGGLEEKATELGVKFGEAFQRVVDKILELKAQFDALDPGMQSFILKSAGIWAGVAVGAGPALKVFGTFLTGLGKVAAVLETFSAGVTGAFASLGAGMTGVVPKLLSFAGIFISILGPAAIGGALLAGLGVAQTMFGDQLNQFFEMAQTKGPGIIQGLVDGIVSKIPELIAQGTILLNNFLNTITANLPVIIQGGADILFGLITGFAQSIPQIIPTVLNLVNTLARNLIIAAPYIIEAGLNLLMALAQGFSENLPTFITMIANLIPLLISQMEALLPMLIEAGVSIIATLLVGLIQTIPVLIEVVPQVLEALNNAFSNVDWASIGTMILEAIFTVFGELGSMLADVFSPVTDWLSEKKDQITETFSNIGSDIQSGWDEAKSFFSDVGSNISSTFEGMKESASKLPGKFKTAAEGIVSGFNTAKQWVTNLPSLFSTKLDEVKTTISKWGSEAKKIFDKALGEIKGFFEKHFGSILPNIEGIFEGIITYFTGVWEIIKNVFFGPILLILTFFTEGFDSMLETAQQIGQNLLDGLSLMWDGIVEVFNNSIGAVISWVVEGFLNIKDQVALKMSEIAQTIRTKWDEIILWLQELPGRLYEWATNTFEQVKTAVTTKMIEIYNTIVEKWDAAILWMSELPSRIWTIITDAFQRVWNTVVEKLTAVYNTIVEKWNAAVEWMSGLPERLWTAATTALQKMLDGVVEKANHVKDKVQEGWDKAVKFLSDIDLMQLGRDAINGFIGGIKEKVNEVGTAVAEVANKVKDGIAGILNMHSPSRVTWAQGGFATEGFALGIAANGDMVESAVSKIAGIVRDTELAFNQPAMEDMNVGLIRSGSSANGYGYSEQVPATQADSQLIEYLQAILEVLYMILEKDPDIILDGDSIVEKIKERMSQAIARMNKDAARNSGLQLNPEGI